MMAERQTNRLIHETSPYLLQHAHNPVDWYAWGKEACSRAKTENKPVLLSIGYSACHWCHVMERESFENEEIASVMNEHFINIKVDCEERPDLDQIYQDAVQLFIQRGGGWPLTMFLTPEGKPFYGGTYFPPEDRYNIPGFKRVLLSVAQAYQEKAQEIEKTTGQVVEVLSRLAPRSAAQVELNREAIKEAVENLAQFHDPVHGGFGGAPKFPHAMGLSLFLRYYHESRDALYLERVMYTLRKMAEGGIYDHLGGGFHRYSVDQQWLVPHFEKMLYDQAQLVPLYLEAFQITGDPPARRVAEETLAYLLREMRHPEGGFYTAQDADSEGEEGKFFIWTHEEVTQILGDEIGMIFCRYYDITTRGNFEGKNILNIRYPHEAVAREFGKSPVELTEILKEARSKLFAVREKRVKPLRDEKMLTSWNGLVLSALVKAYEVLNDPAYLEAARGLAAFVRARLSQGNRLLRTYKDGISKLNGYLDDYAFLIRGLMDLFEATFDPTHLDWAVRLTETMMDQFWDDREGGFFFTSRDHEPLIHRPKSGLDQSIPSGNAVAAHNLLRLSYHTGRQDWREKGEKTLKLFYHSMRENPFGFTSLLCALDFYLYRPEEIVLVGDPARPETQALLREIYHLYLPNRILYLVHPKKKGATPIPALAQGKEQIDGRPTVYVCRNFTCSPPVTDPGRLKELLSQ